LFYSVCLLTGGAGVHALDVGDYATAYKEFKTLAEQGNAEAQYGLGYMYNNGLGVTRVYRGGIFTTQGQD